MLLAIKEYSIFRRNQDDEVSARLAVRRATEEICREEGGTDDY